MSVFVCAECREIYNKVWSDEEAEAEMLERFGPTPDDQKATVCDDCYKRLTGFASGQDLV